MSIDKFKSQKSYILHEISGKHGLRLAETVVTVPEQTLAALRFTGIASEGILATQKNRLTADLASTHWKAQGTVTAYYYDPPWTLPFMRRNEVVVVVYGGKK